MKRMKTLLLTLCVASALMAPARAAPLEYSIDGVGDPEYGKPTSIEVVHTPGGGAMKNEDVSKNAALAPPSFGSPSADTLNTGSPLTPNLAPGYMPTAGAVINGSSGVVQPPAMGGGADTGGSSYTGATTAYPSASGAAYAPGASTVTSTTTVNPTSSTGYTEVTDDLYYSGGYLGTLKIPSLDLSVKIYEGTGSSTLAKGVGHFEEASIWNGNAAFAAHNRGANNYFGQIHTLNAGDIIKLTTKLGTRTYEVTSVSKVSETDRSGLAASSQNMITLYTCVRDQRDLRYCVQGVEIV